VHVACVFVCVFGRLCGCVCVSPSSDGKCNEGGAGGCLINVDLVRIEREREEKRERERTCLPYKGQFQQGGPTVCVIVIIC
jgi:hypothetical protein